MQFQLQSNQLIFLFCWRASSVCIVVALTKFKNTNSPHANNQHEMSEFGKYPTPQLRIFIRQCKSTLLLLLSTTVVLLSPPPFTHQTPYHSYHCAIVSASKHTQFSSFNFYNSNFKGSFRHVCRIHALFFKKKSQKNIKRFVALFPPPSHTKLCALTRSAR